MKKYKHIYRDFFGISEDEYIPCEYCHKERAVDIHHVISKGIGGSKNRDNIENLLGVCRGCHELLHSEPHRQEECSKIGADLIERVLRMNEIINQII